VPLNFDALDSIRGLSAFRNLQVPKAPARPRTAADYALKGALILGRPIGLGLQQVGEALSTPGMVLSEAYGAAEAGKSPLDILKAGWRGVTEPTEKAKYPSFGERLVPEEEGEGFGRKAVRFGAEIATDPLTWVGPGAFKALGKVAVSGAKLVGGSKVAGALARSKPIEALARFAMPMDVVAKYGDRPGSFKWGSALVGKGKKVERQVQRELAEVTNRFTMKAKELGLMRGKGARERRLLAADVIEGKATTSDQAVNDFAKFMQDEWEKTAERVSNFGKTRDPITGRMVRTGPGFKVRLAGGAEVPFELAAKQFGRSYYPQMLTEDAIQRMMTTKGFSEQVESLAKQMNITKAQAKILIEEHTGLVKRAGHIEHSRLPDALAADLERDPLEVFPRYMQQVHRRMATAEEFGVQHEKLAKMLNRAVNAGLPAKVADDIQSAVEGRRVVGAFGLENIGPKITGFQTLSKMGPTSALAQLSQNVNNYIVYGGRNFAKGIVDYITDSPLRQEAAQVFHQGLMHELEREAMLSSKGKGFFGWAPRKWLAGIQFTRMDRGARIIGYTTGRAQAIRLAEDVVAEGKLITPQLRAFGLKPKDVSFFAKNGKFSKEAQRTLGEIASERTQFTTNWTDLPPAWRTPEMRIAMQFKNFTYQQTRMLVREVVVPAAKYFETGGKKGDIAPLVRAMIAFPVAGQGVAALRELFQEQMARVPELFGGEAIKRRKPRKFDEKHPVSQMLHDSMYVGAFGLAGDVLQQASRGRLAGWLAGPTAGDITENLEFGARHLMKGEAPDLEALLGRLYRHMPGRRILPLDPQEVAGAAARALR
jgi:hypothetical protein